MRLEKYFTPEQVATIAEHLAKSLKSISDLAANMNHKQHCGMKIEPIEWSDLSEAVGKARFMLSKLPVNDCTRHWPSWPENYKPE